MKNIHGAKKGGSKQRQPAIASDSAQSKAYISMLYGLGEGEIAGLANGYKSVYLDDTPLQNDNGEFNFPNVKVDFRSGTNDQTYIDGFADVASETAVNIELKHGTPWVKSFNNLDLDAVRVRLKWGALRSQNTENGDVNGVKIDYAIDVKTDNGGWVEMLSTAINAKTSDAYERSHRIDLPTATQGWQVRVRRLTPNSTSDFVSDKMYVSAITEVIDLKLRYPNTALLGLRYDAESFSNVAKMSARCKGLIIKVPTNYDPVSRTYDGLWNGEFKLAYCNNPAWVYYDLCTATRYGLGGRLKEYMIDKWSLYRLAQYCDQMVDDGMGGTEPRFTVNIYIQSAEGAFEILSKLAGVFRAISYWDGTSIVLDADIPQDSMYSFSRANVIDGMFEYTGTRARDRHTVAKVAWDNPANHFKTEYEFVRDEKAIAKFGVRVADIQAWGCTSKGQAQRAGIWALKSEQLETRMVTFKVGLDGYIPAPAKVIEISDELFAGRATGGRVLAINDKKTVITLDRTITAKAGDTLVINGDDGVSQRRQIESVAGDKVTVTKPFDNISVENVWVLDSTDLATMKFRVLSVTADENHQFTITAVQYNSAKYDAIDTGAYIDERPISVINPTVQAPTKSVNVSSYHAVNQGMSITTLVIGWEQVTGAVKYTVEWRKDNGNWQVLPPTGTNGIEIAGVYAGQYEAKVTAISAFGQASLATHSALTQIQGKTGKPNRPAFVRATGVLFGMNLAWEFANGSDDTNFTEIQVSPDGRSNITSLGTFAYPTSKHEITGLQGNLTQYYRARIVDKLGNTSDWTTWVSGTTSADASKVLDIISGQIRDSHLDQTLRTPIAKIGGLESVVNAVNAQLPALNNQIATLNGKATSLQSELNTTKSTLQTAVSNITTERNRINTAIRDITALQSANNAKVAEIANLTNTVNGHTSSIRDLAVTTSNLTQKYSQLKTATDIANSEITAIKQTQSGQATSIERLGTRFDNLAVGGRNLLKHTQRLDQLWRFASGGQGNNMVIADGVARLTGVGTTWRHLGYDINKAAADTWLKDGTAFTLSIHAKKISGNPRLSVALRKGVTGGFKDDLVGRSFDLTNDWQKLVVSGTITPDDLKYLFVRFEFWGDGVIELKKPKLEYGNIATDWTPAPEDVNVDLTPYATNANLETLRQTLTNADTALSQQINAMDTAYKSADHTLTANLASETATRTSADSALGQRIDTLQADYNGNKANIASQLKTLSDKEQALAASQNQLTAKFDNLKIGGRNLLVDSEFRQGKWLFAGHNNQVTHRINNGVLTLGGSLAYWKHAKLTSGVSELNDVLQVGETYTLSVWARSTQGRKYVLISIRNWKDGQFSENIAKREQVGETWQRISVTGVYRQTPHNGQYLDVLLEHGEIGEVEFKQPQLERGSVATDWTPAPEDTEQDFAQTNANMNTLRETLTNADKALSQRIDTMDSEYKAADRQTSAKLGQLEKTVSDKDGATAQRISQLQAEYNALNASKASQAALTAEQNARAEADRAHAESLRQLNSRVDGNASRITTVERTANDTKQALATAHSQLSASYTNLDNKVNNLSIGGRNLLLATGNMTNTHLWQFVKDADQTQVELPRTSNTLTIKSNNQAWVLYYQGSDRNAVLANELLGGETYTLSFEARVSTTAEGYIRAFLRQIYQGGGDNTNLFFTAKQSGVWERFSRTFVLQAKHANHLLWQFIMEINSATVGQFEFRKLKLERGTIPTDYTPAPEDNDALIDEFRQAQATKDGAIAQTVKTLQTTVNGQTASIEQHTQSLNGLQAQWTLKMQTGGVVGGIGLAGNNGVIDFAINANKFYIAPPTGGKGITPFVVLTSPQVINGVRVPAGTYIKSAFIQDGSIDIAKINKASINSLSALSANIGHFKSAEQGARLEIKDSVLLVYDANNTLRVRLGLW